MHETKQGIATECLPTTGSAEADRASFRPSAPAGNVRRARVVMLSADGVAGKNPRNASEFRSLGRIRFAGPASIQGKRHRGTRGAAEGGPKRSLRSGGVSRAHCPNHAVASAAGTGTLDDAAARTEVPADLVGLYLNPPDNAFVRSCSASMREDAAPSVGAHAAAGAASPGPSGEPYVRLRATRLYTCTRR